MSVLLLLAAGGLAREVIALESSLGRYDELFLLDDNPALQGTAVDGVSVIGPIALAADDFDGDLLICAGSGQARRHIAHRLTAMGVRSSAFGRAVHPSVELPPGCSIGPGCIVLSSVVMTTAVHLHRHVVVMPNVTLTHDDVVSDYATLCAGVSLGGRVSVEEGAYLGMNSSVRQDVTVGFDSVLGMGAVLLEDLPAGETWAGVPARSLAHTSASRKQLVP
jgi:sugar O-acyltransferase (sialic acid O-acetyltransferase NeuD family)